MGSTIFVLALLATLSFLLTLNRQLRGARKQHIEAVLALLVAGVLTLGFLALGWKTGLLCLVTVVLSPQLVRPVVRSLAARILKVRLAPVTAQNESSEHPSFSAEEPHPPSQQVDAVVVGLTRSLQARREQFVTGTLAALKRVGVKLSTVPRIELLQGTELDSALRGFQLTTVVGFAWRHLPRALWTPFDEGLTQQLEEGPNGSVSRYREKYLDCHGNTRLLVQTLATDVYRLSGAPGPDWRVLPVLNRTVEALAILSQASTAAAIGDTHTARTLLQLVIHEHANGTVD